MFRDRQHLILFCSLVVLCVFLGSTAWWLLQPCQPLDKALRITGCVYALEFTNIALEGAALSPDNKSLAVTGMIQSFPRRDTVRIMRLDTAEMLWTSPAPDATRALRFTPDGQKLAGASYVQGTRIWDTITGKAIATIPSNAGTLSFSPDSKQVLIALERYSMENYHLLGRVTLPEATTTGVTLPGFGVYDAFSPQSDLEARMVRPTVAGTQDAESTILELYRVNDQQLLHTFPQRLSDNAARLSFSPSGKFIISYYSTSHNWNRGSTLYIWRVPDGKLLRSIRTPKRIENIAWSEDSRWLLTISGHSRSSWVEMYDVAYLDGSRS